jgi:hypothetical protein
MSWAQSFFPVEMTSYNDSGKLGGDLFSSRKKTYLTVIWLHIAQELGLTIRVKLPVLVP